MNGELILTSYTYDDGRVAINDAFSATGYFKNIQADSTITGSTYYSGATPLETIIQTLAGGGIQYAANGLTVTGDTVGLGGIITGETIIHLQGGDLKISGNPAGDMFVDTVRFVVGNSLVGGDRFQVAGSARIGGDVYSTGGFTCFQNATISVSNTTSGFITGGGNIMAGQNNSALTTASQVLLAATEYSYIDAGRDTFILGGSGHTTTNGKNYGIINGYDNVIPTGLENVVMIGTIGETAYENNTVYMPNIHASESISGVTIYSGGTDLSTLFIGAANRYFIQGTGTSSIKANNGTANFASGLYSFSIGAACNAAGFGSFAGGFNTFASIERSFAFGYMASATNTSCIAIGEGTLANGYAAFAANYNSTASGNASAAFGSGTTASGQGALTHGYGSVASGAFSHAGGQATTASGENSSAEGYGAQSIGYTSHAEGFFTTASADYAHAEGFQTTASGSISHAQGAQTTASGNYSHAGGYGGSGQVQAGGEGAFNHQVTLAGPANAAANYSAILGGNDSSIEAGATRAIVLGMNGFTANTADTTYMANTYVDGVLDLNPQEGVSTPTAVRGRMFFSGSPLNRLMVNTGGTANDWVVLP
jgi:trimeric autotransporter adhesin